METLVLCGPMFVGCTIKSIIKPVQHCLNSTEPDLCWIGLFPKSYSALFGSAHWLVFVSLIVYLCFRSWSPIGWVVTLAKLDRCSVKIRARRARGYTRSRFFARRRRCQGGFKGADLFDNTPTSNQEIQEHPYELFFHPFMWLNKDLMPWLLRVYLPWFFGVRLPWLFEVCHPAVLLDVSADITGHCWELYLGS